MVGKRGRQGFREMVAARRASLLRFGLEAEKRSYLSQAIETYQYLLNQYPDSEEGRRAKLRLRELGSASQGQRPETYGQSGLQGNRRS
ncbi:MAG: hypothetical protein A2Y60_04080 [Chloroflexi bacterium RBG_13_54_9]|nr:MAG: hypothetical protein A2Y60_04080 [Chloroflexi bacterium RBG_13_54_9]